MVRPLTNPLKNDSHLVVLHGNLAPEGAVAKISGKEGLDSPARRESSTGGSDAPGDSRRHREGGRRGGHPLRRTAGRPRHARNVVADRCDHGPRARRQDVALITDGRFSGGTHGFVVGHVTPEAALGGPLALVKNGDTITIDATKRAVTLHVAADVLAARRASWRPRAPYARRGVLAKYAELVSSASLGAVTDRGLKVAEPQA